MTAEQQIAGLYDRIGELESKLKKQNDENRSAGGCLVMLMIYVIIPISIFTMSDLYKSGIIHWPEKFGAPHMEPIYEEKKP